MGNHGKARRFAKAALEITGNQLWRVSSCRVTVHWLLPSPIKLFEGPSILGAEWLTKKPQALWLAAKLSAARPVGAFRGKRRQEPIRRRPYLRAIILSHQRNDNRPN
jgi:hypothetical protein